MNNFVFAGKLQDGSEWQQDCLAHLLKLLCLLGTSLPELLASQKCPTDKKSDKPKKGTDEVDNFTVVRKSCLRKQFQQYQKNQNCENQNTKASNDSYIDDIPSLNQVRKM